MNAINEDISPKKTKKEEAKTVLSIVKASH
jgi:hypothetical protein